MIDSLNPSGLPQWQDRPGRYHGHVLAGLMPLRTVGQFRPALYGVPDSAHATLPARGTWTTRVVLPSGSYVWALAATSQQAEGFKAEIVDLGTGRPFFAKPVGWRNLSGQGSHRGVTCPLHLLADARLVVEPGVLGLTLINLSTAANAVQLCLFVAEPEDAA